MRLSRRALAIVILIGCVMVGTGAVEMIWALFFEVSIEYAIVAFFIVIWGLLLIVTGNRYTPQEEES